MFPNSLSIIPNYQQNQNFYHNFPSMSDLIIFSPKTDPLIQTTTSKNNTIAWFKIKTNVKFQDILRKSSPQMRMGASTSTRLGWERKIWRALTQSWRISLSESCTCLPPLPSNSLLIISSKTTLSIIPSIVIIIILYIHTRAHKEN